jgi:hypothetical protein
MLIIGVEQITAMLGIGLVIGRATQEKLLKEPGGVCQMPFTWACEFSPLYRHVSFAEWGGQPDSLIASLDESVCEIIFLILNKLCLDKSFIDDIQYLLPS